MNSLMLGSDAAGPARQAAHPASLRGAAARLAAAVWQGLEACGRARARPEMLAAARRYEHSQPELARALRDACSEHKPG